MIRKIIWPNTFEKGNPFGGKDGTRFLSLTFHSKVYEEISPEELKALEILYEICSVNKIDVMSFDGKIYPKIVFRELDNSEENAVTVINEEAQTIQFTGIYPSRISKDRIIWIMGMYSSSRQHEFNNAREEIIQAEAHYALRRDIFVSTSPFLLKNRDKLDELNIHSPLEALKVVGLYMRCQNEHEWISELKGKVQFLASNNSYFEYFARGFLPANWRFLRYIPDFLEAEDERYLGISVVNRCSSALQARDELAKLFYMPEEYGSSDKRTYHFDYLTLLLTGALDALALILNRLYSLQLQPSECSFSPFRGKFNKTLISKTESLSIVQLIEDAPTKSFLKILYRLRNRIHSVSLDESISVPQDNMDELFNWIYDFDADDHCGMSKRKVMAYINNDPPVPRYDIKIDKYLLSSKLLTETFIFIDRVMDLSAPKDVDGDPPSSMLQYIERYKYFG